MDSEETMKQDADASLPEAVEGASSLPTDDQVRPSCDSQSKEADTSVREAGAGEWPSLNSWRPTLPPLAGSTDLRRSSPRQKKLPVVPSLSTASARRRHRGDAAANLHGCPRDSQADRGSQAEQLMTQNAQLREEIKSLRDMYAKHSAYLELKCDRMMREKEQECTDWYKGKKYHINSMQSAVVIMHGLFAMKQRRLMRQREQDHSEHQALKQDFELQVMRLKEERAMEARQYKDQLKASKKDHEEELADVRQQKVDTEAKVQKLTEQLDDARRESDRLKETHRQKCQELDDTRARLQEVEKSAGHDLQDKQIAALEAELQTTRRKLTDKWKKEVESLRQELMDYVRFIVHILPENWAETEAADKVPIDLRDQLSWMAGSKGVSSPTATRGSPRGKRVPTSPKAHNAGAGHGGQYARLETSPLATPRKRGVDGMDAGL